LLAQPAGASRLRGVYIALPARTFSHRTYRPENRLPGKLIPTRLVYVRLGDVRAASAGVGRNVSARGLVQVQLRMVEEAAHDEAVRRLERIPIFCVERPLKEFRAPRL